MGIKARKLVVDNDKWNAMSDEEKINTIRNGPISLNQLNEATKSENEELKQAAKDKFQELNKRSAEARFKELPQVLSMIHSRHSTGHSFNIQQIIEAEGKQAGQNIRRLKTTVENMYAELVKAKAYQTILELFLARYYIKMDFPLGQINEDRDLLAKFWRDTGNAEEIAKATEEIFESISSMIINVQVETESEDSEYSN